VTFKDDNIQVLTCVSHLHSGKQQQQQLLWRHEYNHGLHCLLQLQEYKTAVLQQLCTHFQVFNQWQLQGTLPNTSTYLSYQPSG
jgi:hypothetical protein